MELFTHQELDVAVLEVLNDAAAVVLVDAAVEGHAGVRVLHELLHELIGVLLLVHEHDHPALLLVLAQQLQQLEELLLLLQHHLQHTGNRHIGQYSK